MRLILLLIRFADNLPPLHTRGAAPSARESSPGGAQEIHHRHQPPGDELQQLSLPRTDGFPAQRTCEEFVHIDYPDLHTVHRRHNVSIGQPLHSMSTVMHSTVP